MKKIICLLPLLFLLVSCTGTSSPEDPESPVLTPVETPEESPVETPDSFVPKTYGLVEAYGNLVFDQPLAYTSAHDGSGLSYVVERTGKIMVFRNVADVDKADVFLDLSAKISSRGQEQGLLGLAFDPDFKENGYFYVNYTTTDSTVISRFGMTKDRGGFADVSSEKVLLTFNQPFANHNGGVLEFGPDGYLYIGTGDGGSGGDPQGNAQNLRSFLGKILRIDVRGEEDGKPYGIPSDNPFKGSAEGFLPEIYAYGLRNPWKISFDPERNLMIAADVGQDKIEEIDIIENGGNYGWNAYEGTQPYDRSSPVDPDNLIMPVHEYSHQEGKSVTGGFFYYGQKNKSLWGTYVYGDFISGRIWALDLDGTQRATNHELLDSDLKISSFGLDDEGELYIIDFGGEIYTLEEKD